MAGQPTSLLTLKLRMTYSAIRIGERGNKNPIFSRMLVIYTATQWFDSNAEFVW